MMRRLPRRASGRCSAVPEPDVWVCPACGYVPESAAERTRHQDGIDERHLACAHQDIEAINARQRPARDTIFGMPWG